MQTNHWLERSTIFLPFDQIPIEAPSILYEYYKHSQVVNPVCNLNVKLFYRFKGMLHPFVDYKNLINITLRYMEKCRFTTAMSHFLPFALSSVPIHTWAEDPNDPKQVARDNWLLWTSCRATILKRIWLLAVKCDWSVQLTSWLPPCTQRTRRSLTIPVCIINQIFPAIKLFLHQNEVPDGGVKSAQENK